MLLMLVVSDYGESTFLNVQIFRDKYQLIHTHPHVIDCKQ
jgi:hypothetical protein